MGALFALRMTHHAKNHTNNQGQKGERDIERILVVIALDGVFPSAPALQLLLNIPTKPVCGYGLKTTADMAAPPIALRA